MECFATTIDEGLPATLLESQRTTGIVHILPFGSSVLLQRRMAVSTAERLSQDVIWSNLFLGVFANGWPLSDDLDVFYRRVELKVRLPR